MKYRYQKAIETCLEDKNIDGLLILEMIRFEVLHQKALAAGYDKDPEIQAEVKRMLVAKFQERHFAKERSLGAICGTRQHKNTGSGG